MSAPDTRTQRLEALLFNWRGMLPDGADATMRALAVERDMFKDFNSRHELKAAAEKINTDVAKVERDEARTERDAARAEVRLLHTELLRDREERKAVVAARNAARAEVAAKTPYSPNPEARSDDSPSKE